MAQQVILYDIPTKAPAKSWSFNPWKVRMVLNLKGVDYKTEWVEYPDIMPTLKGFGLPPNDPKDPGYFADYTSPAIRYADGTYAMDSMTIARALEKQYPSPPLHIDDPVVAKLMGIAPLMPLGPYLLPKIPRKLLSERSAEYFYLTREERFGMPLEQLEREKGTEECWEKAAPLAKQVGDLLREKEGPFFLGNEISYADVIFVTILKFIERLNESSFQRYLALDPAFPKVYEASKKWLAKED